MPKQSFRLYIAILLLFVFNGLTLVSCKHESDKPRPSRETFKEQAPYVEEEPVNPPQTTSQPLKYEYRYLDSTDIPPVVIVIDDFGQIGGDLLQGYAELDENITFAVLPDLPNTAKAAKLANVYGHEVIIHIPMEAQDKSQNPGKTYIKAGADEKSIKNILNGFIDQIPQAVGANNHMGSAATADYEVMKSVLQTLDRNGLFFLDSKTSAASQVANAARDLDTEYTARDIFLDVPDVSPATLNSKLQQLHKYRGRVEPVIIISHCHNQAKLDAMRSFVAQLKALDIKLIPLSEAVGKFKLPV
jgi:polysaccharide deacetylase 2 family uncharacterized protein YibQ